MRNPVKAVLFDLDGTLLFSRDTLVDAVYQTMQRFNYTTISHQTILRRFGTNFEKVTPPFIYLEENLMKTGR